MTDRPTVEVKLTVRLLPVLVGILLALQLFIPFRGWRLLLVGLGGTWLVAYLWARALARGLQIAREVRFGWAQVGDLLEERFTLVNSSAVPALWAEVVDLSNLPGYSASRVSGVSSGQENHWLTRGTCTRRGLFVLGPTTLRTGDPFGIYTVSLHNPASTTLMVTPPVVPLPTIEVAPGGRSGEGRPRPNVPERTVNAAGVRDYLPGDSPRWIHWPATAHRGSLAVRVFDGAPVADWWIFLDLFSAVQAGEGQTSTQEHGVILAASLADRGLRLGRAVGLVACGAELAWLAPKPGDNQRLNILRTLALVETGPRSLAELLERARPALGRRSSIVIITPDTTGEWISRLLAILRGNAVATAILLDPASFTEPNAGQGMDGTAALLSELDISHYVVTRDLLDRPEARPGRQGVWEWRTLASGRVIPVQQPGETQWRPLR